MPPRGALGRQEEPGGEESCPSGAGGSDDGGVPAGSVTQARQVSAEEPYNGCPTNRG